MGYVSAVSEDVEPDPFASRGSANLLVLPKIKKILEAFSVANPDPTLPDLIKQTGLPRSTCQRLAQNLVNEGFLRRDGQRYRIGLDLVRLAAPGTLGVDLVQLTRPVLQDLRDQTEETACLYVRDRGFRIVVGVAETRQVVMRLFTVGMVMPLHAGSAGKVFMAFDKDALSAALDEGLHPYTEHTITDVERLEAQLEVVRRQGWAMTSEEREPGAASVSAPIYGHDGELRGVLGIGAPTQRLNKSTGKRWVAAVKVAANEASLRMGAPLAARPQS